MMAGAALIAVAAVVWLGWSAARTSPDEPAAPPTTKAPVADDEDSSRPETPRDAIVDLMSKRAAAIRSGDRAGFVSSIDPRSRAFRKRQLRVFNRLTSLPLDTYELEVVTGTEDLAKARHERRYKRADDVYIPPVEEHYRFKGFDDADFVSDLFFTFVRRGDDWFIATDDDLRGRSTTDRGPWDFGPVRTLRSKNFLVVQHPCDDSGCIEADRSFLQSAETALDNVNERWLEPWNKRVVVFVTSTQKELKSLLDVNFGVARFAAFAYAPSRLRGYSPARIVVNHTALPGRSLQSIEVILAHELTHVATRRPSGPDIPQWVDEGLAEYVARSPGDVGDLFFDQQIAVGALTPELPKDRDFRRGNDEELFGHYQSSRSAVLHFIDRYGYKRFVRFYRALGDSHEMPGSAREHVNEMMRRFTGLNLKKFKAQWTDSIGG